jgi:hypothetical protein
MHPVVSWRPAGVTAAVRREKKRLHFQFDLYFDYRRRYNPKPSCDLSYSGREADPHFRQIGFRIPFNYRYRLTIKKVW